MLYTIERCKDDDIQQLPFTERSKKISGEYKNLPKETQQQYQKQLEQMKEQYQQDMKEFYEKYPAQKQLDEQAQKIKNHKASLKRMYNKPEFMLFCLSAMQNKIDINQLEPQKLLKKFKTHFLDLDDQQMIQMQKVVKTLSEQQKKDVINEFEAYFGQAKNEQEDEEAK